MRANRERGAHGTENASSCSGPNGERVFSVEFPIRSSLSKGALSARSGVAWAPTLNEYNGLEPWQKALLRKAIDWQIASELPKWPRWRAGFSEEADVFKGKLRIKRIGGHKRVVNVTRESSKEPDEPGSADSVGGKAPLDRLVHAGVLVDDSTKWITRSASWKKVARGSGRVIIDVWE